MASFAAGSGDLGTTASAGLAINAVLVESQGDMALAERAYQALSVGNEAPWTRLELAEYLKVKKRTVYD